MADNTRKQDKGKNQISSFYDILSDIRAILSDFWKEIPEVIENSVYDRCHNDQEKLSIMAPTLEEDIGPVINIKVMQIPQIKPGAKVPLFLTQGCGFLDRRNFQK